MQAKIKYSGRFHKGIVFGGLADITCNDCNYSAPMTEALWMDFLAAIRGKGIATIKKVNGPKNEGGFLFSREVTLNAGIEELQAIQHIADIDLILPALEDQKLFDLETTMREAAELRMVEPMF